MNLPQVIILGGGFGGLNAAKALGKKPLDVTLIDRNNYHLFQPLLYQVATAALSSVDVAAPIRHVLRKQKRTEVLMAEVKGIDLENRKVHLEKESLPFDFLILALGSQYHYFGHPEWADIAPGLKSVSDALEIRRKVLLAFERAEMEEDPAKRKAFLNFVVVGGGPTGVELAGSIGELAHRVLAKDFRNINPASARILLVEAGPRILAPFPEELSAKAKIKLENLGVEVRENTRVQKIETQGVILDNEFIPAQTVLWAAGVRASPLLETLGVPLDRTGRIAVNADLSIPGHPNVFAIGDVAQFLQDGKPLPGLAPVAIQQGKHLATVITSRLNKEKIAPSFNYLDKGQLATVGRSFAIAHFGKLKLTGFLGWLIWVFVHIMYLVGFQTRALVFFQWAWQYFSYERGARIIPSRFEKKESCGA